jgi:hypothetical protein
MRYLELVVRASRAGNILIASAVLLSAGFYNGYPLVTADAATYLASGFLPETPFDRPITYGLFLRAASMNGFSLWPVIALQALITAALLHRLLRHITSERRAGAGLLILSVILTLATPLSWVVSSLMPDIFTPVALLSLLLIILEKPGKGRHAGLFILYFVSVCMHMSHVLMFSVLIVALFLARKWIGGLEWKARLGLRRMGLLLFLTAGAIAAMGSAFAKSRHVFFMGAMVERGVAGAFLDEYCPTVPYRLCPYKDQLPRHGYDFVWAEDGPMQRSGGWAGSRDEYSAIIKATLTKPKYIWLQIRTSLAATCVQLGLFRPGDGNVAFREGSSVYAAMKQYLPRELKRFGNSRQNTGDMRLLSLWQQVIKLGVAAGALLLLLLALPGIWQNDRLRGIALVLISGVVLNAWACATFANSIDRLGARMVWLVLLAAIPLAMHALAPGSIRRLLKDGTAA